MASVTPLNRGWLLCEPNVSEGRDEARMTGFAEAVAETAGVELIHRSSDPDHHRMVLAYLGPPEAVVQATMGLAAAVYGSVDLRRHRGAHPRVGALDVVPFVRGPGCGEVEALAACRSFGAWAAARGIPVFFYERAAASCERASLPRIRSGQFEGLASKLARPEWRPDLGPPAPHPSAGAVVVGLRAPLVRFNVNLGTRDPGPARRLAGAIRESGGGLPYVRALGISLKRRGLTQVSLNLTRYAVTSVDTVYDRVAEGARAEGVMLAGSEFIGPVPAGALRGVDIERLDAELDADQILDLP
ncbi:glutamate formimidoyltransferase [Candidatus Palauibacter sp.]|uniref:glutamate formimidoyltransferase n=1 Tax=Candidatus Palauibacter sp. TaxID=3101350 RepID=UPI003B5C2D8E